MPNLPQPFASLEAAIRARGDELLDRVESAPPPAIFSRRGLLGQLMDWAMRDAAFRTQLFRFVDVLPTLSTSPEVVRHLQEYLGDRAVDLHPALKGGLAMAGVAPAVVAGPVRANITAMARQFVVGETAEELARHLLRRAGEGIAITVDLLGEKVVSEEEADRFQRRNLDVIEAIAQTLRDHPAPCFSDLDTTGPLPRLNLSLKVSALAPERPSPDVEGTLAATLARLIPILRRASELSAFINLDMEAYDQKPIVLGVFRRLLTDPAFTGGPRIGIAIQAYLRDAEQDLLGLVALGRSQKRRFAVRLVKGAYWDFETMLAAQRGWATPVWTEKAETDVAFERLTELLFDHRDVVEPAIATHNVRSMAHAIACADARGIAPNDYEFQLLYGMADDLKTALRAQGHRVREYSPVGELLPGMAYLVRRLLENTSNEGFVRQRATGAVPRDRLLESPQATIDRLRQSAPAATAPSSSPSQFRNAPCTDLRLPEAQSRIRSAIAACRKRFGDRYPLVIGSKKIRTPSFDASTNPANPKEVVGHVARGTAEHAEAAIDAAHEALPAFSRTGHGDRCHLIERAASLMESRRAEFVALMVLEAGKPWVEADAEVSEAVDFCRFYACEMRRLGGDEVTQKVPGEACRQIHRPRGVGAVIAPWNFPLAILTGMSVAGLVGGNTVVLKPAEQTPVIAARLVDLLREAGVPAGAVNLVFGRGEEVGAQLVASPRVAWIAFTGSREVGTSIWGSAGRTAPGQTQLKKVVCEMGGKNALIVDADADLDEAVVGVVQSAFGYAGQKCSALSRLILIDSIHDEFLRRLAGAAASLVVGNPEDPSVTVGPIIDAEAATRIREAIARAKEEAEVAYEGAGPEPPGGGNYIWPTIFRSVKSSHRIARNEIFGPVLATFRAHTIDEAFALANDTDYALTGGIYSRSPRTIQRAEEELNVGNLYVNRGITGAIVERHPFGGYKLSGGGTKAGGRGYVEEFLVRRVIAENTLRRGFAPE